MNLQLETILITAINFLILLFILSKLLFKPLSKMLDKRKAAIASELEAAEAERLAASDAKKAVTLEIAAAQGKASEIIAEAASIGNENQERIIKEAREQADMLLKKAAADAAAMQENAKTALQRDVIDMAVAISGKILNQNLTITNQEELINQFISQIGAKS